MNCINKVVYCEVHPCYVHYLYDFALFVGGNWPCTVALWMVEGLTSKACVGAESKYALTDLSCSGKEAEEVRNIQDVLWVILLKHLNLNAIVYKGIRSKGIKSFILC